MLQNENDSCQISEFWLNVLSNVSLDSKTFWNKKNSNLHVKQSFSKAKYATTRKTEEVRNEESAHYRMHL